MRTLHAALSAFLMLDVTAMLYGRNPIELLMIYYMDRQARNVSRISLHAPNIFSLIHANGRHGTIRDIAYLFAAALVVGVIYVLILRGVEMTPERVITAAALFAIMVPFLLPGMHERYFFLADVLTVVLVVYRPHLWYVPLLVQASSLLSYQTYLFGPTPQTLPMVVPGTLMLAALLTVGYHLLKDAVQDEPAQQEPAAEATTDEDEQSTTVPDTVAELDPVSPAYSKAV